jgi:hypothetical protein
VQGRRQHNAFFDDWFFKSVGAAFVADARR